MNKSCFFEKIHLSYFAQLGYGYGNECHFFRGRHFFIGFYWDYKRNVSERDVLEYYDLNMGIYTVEFGEMSKIRFSKSIDFPKLYQCVHFEYLPSLFPRMSCNYALTEMNVEEMLGGAMKDVSELMDFAEKMKDTSNLLDFLKGKNSCVLSLICSFILMNEEREEEGTALFRENYPFIGVFWKKRLRKAIKRNENLRSFSIARELILET